MKNMQRRFCWACCLIRWPTLLRFAEVCLISRRQQQPSLSICLPLSLFLCLLLTICLPLLIYFDSLSLSSFPLFFSFSTLTLSLIVFRITLTSTLLIMSCCMVTDSTGYLPAALSAESITKEKERQTRENVSRWSDQMMREDLKKWWA